MNSKAMTVSVLMAGIAVFFVMTSVSSIEEEAKRKFGEDVTVLVAKEDIKEMDTLIDGMIEPKVVPRRFVEPAAIAFNTMVNAESPDYALESKRIIGNIAIVPIKKGEQLSLNKITEPGMRTGLAPQVTPGRRAISINVDETASVSKLVKPGDRVDIIAVIDMGSGAGGRETKIAKTIMQDIVILAVGRNVTNNLARKIDVDQGSGRARIRSLNEFDGFSSVTVEVDPSQAQTIAAIAAQTSNRIILTLRNNDDTDRTNLGASRPTDVLSDGIRVPATSGPNGVGTGMGGSR